MQHSSFSISGSNQRDFRKYRWLFFVFIIIWGGAMIILLNKLKWILLVAYTALYFSFKKSFTFEFKIFQTKIILHRKFLGITYHRTKQIFTNVLFFSNPACVKFQGKNDALFILLELDSISIRKSNHSFQICTKQNANNTMQKILSALNKLNIDSSIQIL